MQRSAGRRNDANRSDSFGIRKGDIRDDATQLASGELVHEKLQVNDDQSSDRSIETDYDDDEGGDEDDLDGKQCTSPVDHVLGISEGESRQHKLQEPQHLTSVSPDDLNMNMLRQPTMRETH